MTCPSDSAPHAAAFEARRVVSTYTQTIDAPPDVVFPLLCPIRENDWAKGWSAQVVFAASGLAEEDGVYTVQRPGRDDATWIVTRRDPAAHAIEFVCFEPRLRVARLTVVVSPLGTSQSRVAIKYVNTGLSAEGNAFVTDTFTGDRFTAMMTGWEAEMNHYLRTGRMLQ